MSKELKKNVPQLRFPEFEEDWAIKKLGDICDCIVPGRNKPKTFNGDIPWITTPDIENGKINILSTSLKISYEEARSIGSKVVPKGSVLMSCAGEIGITAITDCEIVINQQLHAFIPPHDVINKYFLFYGIQTQKKYIDSIATKTAVPYLNKNNCNSISIPLPSLAEQEKIASFLGAIDTRLTQLRRKQELLHTYKRGVMQKLFSQEVRFKGAIGSAFPDWQKKKLGDLASRQVKKNLDESITRVLTNSAVQGVIDQQDYFDKDIANADNLGGYYIIKKGDYVYNPRISASAPVGPIHKNRIGLGVMSPLYTIFRFNTKEDAFYEQYLKTSFWHKYMCSVANYGARYDRMSITTSDFMALTLPYPVLEEQEKIVGFLTAIDRKIETLSRQIDHTEQFKKGLLQKMFV